MKIGRRMIGSLLTILLCASLADSVGDRRVRLVADDAAEGRTISEMTQEQLGAEYQRINQSRPSLLGPIALTGLGLASGFGGPYLCYLSLGLLFGNIYGAGTQGLVLLVLGGVAFFAGIACVIAGVIALVIAIRGEAAASAKLAEVRSRLQVLPSANSPPTLLNWPQDANRTVPGDGYVVLEF